MQAYLETDPSDRSSKDEYVMRYQRFARDELEQAISKYDQLCSTLGARWYLFLPACVVGVQPARQLAVT